MNRDKYVELINFNPRSPHGERPDYTAVIVYRSQFQSTLPARGATRKAIREGKIQVLISIHAPRTGSDQGAGHPAPAGRDFNPRSPHGERRKLCAVSVQGQEFQSTLPARGATCATCWTAGSGRNFNPRSPHGERPTSVLNFFRSQEISIHAPRTGSDSRDGAGKKGRSAISIHAPRTGSDNTTSPATHSITAFQSTLPARGATRTICHHILCR